MLPEYKTKTNIGVGLGLLVQSVSLLLIRQGGLATVLALVGLAASVVLFISGCSMYAVGKGHDAVWGFLGLLSLVGLLILFALPDAYAGD